MIELSENDRKLLARLGVDSPVQNFHEILQHLMSFRNEWVLHRRKCDFTGEPIISAYPDKTIFPVYKNEIWWGDKWQPQDYGRDIDFSKPFFPQIFDLQCVVPREGTSIFNSENCDYNSHARESRNCYLNSLTYRTEDTYYSYWAVNDKNVVDCFITNNSTLAYDCIDCDNLYECVHLQDCISCSNTYFSYQLRGCEQCIGCYNLVNKRLYAFNKPVTETEFKRIKSELLNGSREGYLKGEKIFEDIISKAPHRALQNINIDNSFGDHLRNCKNCNYAFDGVEGEDVNHTLNFESSKNILACLSAGWPSCEDVYFSAVTRGSQNIAFCYYTFYSSGLRYCDSSMSCHDCFGCIGLRHAKNCILNKAYTAHEYETLVRKLTGHMRTTGEWSKFFPKDLSTFPYNQSAAQQHFPLTPNTATKNGWIWRDVENQFPNSNLKSPNSLSQISKSDLNAVYACVETNLPFKLIKPEYEFYLKMSLPPPERAPQARHLIRLNKRNKFHLYNCTCAGSGAEICTTFPPEKNVKVYSEEEYLKTLV